MVARRFFKALVNGDFYVALVSAGLPLTIYAMYDIPLVDITPIAITIFITFMIYAINRQVDQEADEINLPERTNFVKKYGKPLTLLSVALTLFAFYLAFIHSVNVLFASFIAAAIGYFYSYPFVHLGRFKNKFIWKNIGVGLIYAALALITIVYFGVSTPIETFVLLFIFFSNWFLISSFFDLRDVEGDLHAGIKTIPIAVGKRNILPLLHLINLLPVLLVGSLVLLSLINFRFIFVAIFTFLYTVVYLVGRAYEIDMKFLCMVLADATPFAVSMILLFFIR
jgi:4-hydroxybenzoate polyprenyltransferase